MKSKTWRYITVNLSLSTLWGRIRYSCTHSSPLKLAGDEWPTSCPVRCNPREWTPAPIELKAGWAPELVLTVFAERKFFSLFQDPKPGLSNPYIHGKFENCFKKTRNFESKHLLWKSSVPSAGWLSESKKQNWRRFKNRPWNCALS